MIFNVRNRGSRVKVQWVLVKMQMSLERAFAYRIRLILNKQCDLFVKQVEMGVFDLGLLNTLRGIILKEISEEYTRVGAVFFNMMKKAFKEQLKISSEKIEAFESEFWNKYHTWTLMNATNQTRYITRTTQKRLSYMLDQITALNETYKQTAERIKKEFRKYNYMRAMKIARTEVHTAASYAVDQAVRISRIPVKREWVAVWDRRTRPEHVRADGQIKGLNESFVIGEEHLMYPGDIKVGVNNRTNCRCSLYYHIL